MAQTEDGEFELILGNRQLLSVFFIVVILLGVFFTMGYIVGRNSAPVGANEIANARKAETKPLVVESPARDAATAPAAPTPSAPPAETAAQEPAPAVAPKVPEPAPTTRSEEAKAKPREPEKPRVPEKPPAAVPPQSSDQPTTGETFLQLAATSQREGDIMVDVLRKKGFKSRSAEIPEKPGTYRVLVGPLDPADVNRMRAALQAAGFPGNAAIRRTF